MGINVLSVIKWKLSIQALYLPTNQSTLDLAPALHEHVDNMCAELKLHLPKFIFFLIFIISYKLYFYNF